MSKEDIALADKVRHDYPNNIPINMLCTAVEQLQQENADKDKRIKELELCLKHVRATGKIDPIEQNLTYAEIEQLLNKE